MTDYLNDTIPTNLTYSATSDNGHASANVGLCLGLDGTGNDAHFGVLVANRKKIYGVFLELRRSKNATVQVFSQKVVVAGDQNAFRVGDPIVGAGSGKAKSPTARTSSYVQNTEEEWAQSRGQVLRVLTNTSSGSTAEVLLN